VSEFGRSASGAGCSTNQLRLSFHGDAQSTAKIFYQIVRIFNPD
jgi:hypothetical protein